MPDPRDIVDIRGVNPATTSPPPAAPRSPSLSPTLSPSPASASASASASGYFSADTTARRGRPWLAVRWRCCGGYSRIYRNAGADAYEGRCPRCGRSVRARVGQDGVSSRFFEAG